MNWDAIGSVGEIIGALAVIASLLYLAVQIKTNTTFARAQSQRDLLRTYEFFNATLDPAIARIVRIGLSRYELLTNDEKIQFHSWAHPFINQVEATYRMHRQGLIEEASYIGFRNGVVSIVICPGGALFWEDTKKMIGQDFVEEIDRIAQSKTDSILPWTTLLPHFNLEPGDVPSDA